MTLSPKIAIVNGYGIVLDDSYRAHLDKVVQMHEQEDFDKIVLTGGSTHEFFPLATEARVMLAYLVKQGVPTEKIVLEERALTTRQNLYFSYSHCIVHPRVFKNIRVSVFCKKPWWLKVRFLSWLTFRPYPTMFRVKVIGTAPANGWKEWGKQLLATPYEVASHFFPKLEEIKLRRKFLWKFETH